MSESLPAWLCGLRTQSVAGVRWLTGEEQEEYSEKLINTAERVYEFVPLQEQDRQTAVDTLQRAVPVGIGPTRTNGMGMSWTANVLFHPDSPNHLFLQLFHEYPYLLWVPLGDSVTDIANGISAYFQEITRPDPALFQKTYRVFLCQANEEISQLSQLAHYFRENLFCDEAQWGNSQLTDPFIGRNPNYQELTDTRAAFTQNDPAYIPTISFRTRHTDSIIKIEDHRTIFMAEIQYNPVKPSPLIAHYNDHYETHFAEDIPVDVVATLLSFPIRRY